MRKYVKPAILLSKVQTALRTQGTGFPLASCDSSIDCPDQETNSRLGVVECENNQLEIIIFLSGSQLNSADFFSTCQIEGISGLDFSDGNCSLTESPLLCQDGYVYDFMCDFTALCPSSNTTVVLSCAGYESQGNCSVELN